MGSHVEVPGGVRMWFEEEGGGDATTVVLLHGGMVNADTWALQAPVLAAGRRVLRPDRRGHGRTADPGDITYDLMAADTIAFIEQVADPPVDLVGWSDGGVVSLLVALARPDLVRRMVLIGVNFHHEGTLPQFLDGADSDDDGMVREMYAAVSPDGPDHWPVVKAKIVGMWRSTPTLTTSDLRRIEAPTLVLVADDDAIAFDHTIALYESLAAGQLAVVPGSSHLVPIEKPDGVNRLLLDFLDDGTVVSMLPLRRAAAPA